MWLQNKLDEKEVVQQQEIVDYTSGESDADPQLLKKGKWEGYISIYNEVQKLRSKYPKNFGDMDE